MARVTEKSLAWLPKASRRAWFSVVDYSQEASRTGLPRILSSTAYRYEFREAYASQELERERVEELLSASSASPALSSLFLPFELVVRSERLMETVLGPLAPVKEGSSKKSKMKKYCSVSTPRLMGEETAKYVPESVLLSCKESLIPEVWKEKIFTMINDDPILCASLHQIRCGLEYGIECSWASYFPGAPNQGSKGWYSEFHLMDVWLYELIAKRYEYCAPEHSQSSPVAEKDFNRLFQKLVESGDLSVFPKLASIVGELTAKMSETGRSLWHGRILLITLHKAEDRVPLSKKQKGKISQYFIKYVQAYDPKIVPPFILKDLGVKMAALKIQLPTKFPDEIYQKLLFLDIVSRRQRGFWGGLDRYLFVWRTGQVETKPTGAERITFENDYEILKWWSIKIRFGYIQSPAYPIAVMLVRGDGSRAKIDDLLVLLGEITRIISSEETAFNRDSLGRLLINSTATVPDYFWPAACRTIVYNLFFFGDARINLSPETWEELYNPKNFAAGAASFTHVGSLSKCLHEWGLQGCIPLEMLVGKIFTTVIPKNSSRQIVIP